MSLPNFEPVELAIVAVAVDQELCPECEEPMLMMLGAHGTEVYYCETCRQWWKEA